MSRRNDAAIYPSARPFEIHPEGARRGVLLLHGYTGRPKDLRYQAERLADDGFGVSVPRLPGCGSSLQDLSRVNRMDWRRRSLDAFMDLKSHYSEVSILGYSLGGLLALHLATRVDTDRIVLLAPGVAMSNRMLKLAPLLAPISRFIPEFPTGWSPAFESNEEDREYGREYWVRREPRSAAELLKIRRETGREMRGVKTPVMLVLSTKDNEVPLSALKLLERRLPEGVQKKLIVKRCFHDLPQGADREIIADSVIEWLKTGEKRGSGILPANSLGSRRR